MFFLLLKLLLRNLNRSIKIFFIFISAIPVPIVSVQTHKMQAKILQTLDAPKLPINSENFKSVEAKLKEKSGTKKRSKETKIAITLPNYKCDCGGVIDEIEIQKHYANVKDIKQSLLVHCNNCFSDSYACPFCFSIFKTKRIADLKQHLLDRHDQTSCSLCKFSSEQVKFDLYNHTLEHHVVIDSRSVKKLKTQARTIENIYWIKKSINEFSTM